MNIQNIDNLELFYYSLENEEDYADKYYKKDKLIITKDKTNNALMQANNNILRNINAYIIAKQNDNNKIIKTILDNLKNALKTLGINNSEFVKFWGVYDMSYTGYKALNNQDKEDFLLDILDAYIKERHSIYETHGYTPTTLQVCSDSFAHKRSGSLGSNKVNYLLSNFEINKYMGTELQGFYKEINTYICPDSDGSKIFKEFIRNKQIDFNWNTGHQGKQTDFLLKLGDNYLIIEHKHMKEGGGGQDKQISEVIDFIREEENGISYVVFLDGVYFNKFSTVYKNGENQQNGKILTQYNNIIDTLKNNKSNFFVNTAGFLNLIENLI